ncbi:unnamed protein product [Bursaphelenchus okinawaensis]|uniref:Lysophospholipid acyltransferase 5 n=1 Tax=Bursaphelenchus okinawaensis TaxID=465554 RepID=A0A811K575_9BILA|nr:unnamed protein product [Bursaphelenchus okinawaensis]CAG9091490.1 unnamed protein product [Bursaphelenchus okinawaensis]
MGVISELSNMVNVREDGLRLLISIVLGYPISAFYRYFIYNLKPKTQHIFFTTVGLSLLYFNCGLAVWHFLLSIVLAYFLTNFIPGTKTSVALAHIFFLGHLLLGYWNSATAQYDITWTTPFCIMALRFIALVMDCFDGQKPRHKRKGDQLELAIEDPPTLLEIASFGLFYGGTLVGPLFSFNRFRRFVNGEFLENGEVKESSLMEACRRFVAGVTYAVLHQWGTLWVPDSYFNSQEFFDLPFHWKIIWNTIWFRATMYRYCMCWLLTEGSCILAGLAYNGKNEAGEDKWDGVRNVHIVKWELGSDFQSVIDSFNCGTNDFAKNYLFKRLRWLGGRIYSQSATLFYLAVWHGYHLGYFLLFAFEMACMFVQGQLYELLRRLPHVQEVLSRPYVWPFCWLFGRITINTSMAMAFFTFGLIKKEVWIKPLLSMYCYWYVIMFFLAPLTLTILLKTVPKPKSHKTESQISKKSE